VNVEVGKLTVRAVSGANTGSTSRRAEYLLRRFDWQPGLPEHAILIVRHLEINHNDDGSADQHARTALADLGRAAARAAAGPVPAHANAVVFADEAELLTCLTVDLMQGFAESRWYWRRVHPVRAGGRGTALAAAWLRYVRWLPAAIAQLTELEADGAVALLSSAQISRVADAMLDTYGVPRQRSRQLSPSPRQPVTASGSAAGRSARDPLETEPPLAAALVPDGATVLRLARSLHHSPSAVRRLGYLDWLTQESAAPQRPWMSSPTDAGPPAKSAASAASPATSRGLPARLGSGGRALRSAPVAPRTASDRAMRNGVYGRGANQQRPASELETAAADSAPVTCADGWLRGATAPASALETAAADSTPVTCADGWLRGATAPASEPRPMPLTPDRYAPLTSELPDAGVRTGLASLMFLVNLVVWLYPEYDAPLLGGWAQVELLGRYLLRSSLDELANDPIWDLLAELDGRRGGNPATAAELAPVTALRLPRSWVRRWVPPDSRFLAQQIGPHLVIRHSDGGFVVADVPCTAGQAAEVCRFEAELLDSDEIVLDSEVAGTTRTPSRRFDDCAGAFAAWLLRSRGVDVAALAAPGQVRCTATHVDVDLSLEGIDLPVRIAGLDRDPGWVPALGRIVLFHYR
jgi:hypothetical protein